MNCTQCIAQLHDFVDGDLPAAETRAVELHLNACAGCRGELASLRALRGAAAALPREISPARDLWPDIAAKVAATQTARTPTTVALPTSRPDAPTISPLLQWFAPLAMAASIVLFASLADRTSAPPASGPGWRVASLAGAPRVGAKTVRGEAMFRVGQWLETDARSRASVTVGSIGEVKVEPNSRLRLVDAAANDHRLELARGTMQAFIYAPPRIFFVDTPSATAVDLGCAYTLTVNAVGDGELRVQMGYVALEDNGRQSFIPGGFMCYTRVGVGPGTPFSENAREPLRAALQRFDFDKRGRETAVKDVLTHASENDDITLWHLLTRAAPEQRGMIYDKLAQHRPPPEGVTREGILFSDPNGEMHRTWGASLGINPFAWR